MSRHDVRVTLMQMRDHAAEALSFCSGKSFDDLRSDRKLQLALHPLVEIVGEAANRVPDAFQAAHLEIPWPSAIATRNRLIHGYDRVDDRIVWGTVHKDFPRLVSQLERLIAALGPQH